MSKSEKSKVVIPKLTPEQKRAVAAAYLGELELGRLPYEIFSPVARLVVMNTVEVAFVRFPEEDEESAQILLTQRDPDDEYWPSQWHIPGSVVLSSDPVRHRHDYDAAISRVLDEVGGDVSIVGGPRWYDYIRSTGMRGGEITEEFLAEVEGSPENGKFFNIASVLRQPPEEGFVETHAETIRKVAANYQLLRTTG